jgi:hypothetical protein
MPSAEELSKLYSKENHMDAFLEVTIKDIEMCAKQGSKSAVVDVPSGLTRADVDTKLKEAFPGCKVVWGWFIQSYRISW